jgi:carboxyl-terminal processing protease
VANGNWALRTPIGGGQWLLLLAALGLSACAPSPETRAPVVEPARAPEPQQVLATELARQTLSSVSRDHVIPVTAGELQARFVRRLRDPISEGPWRGPLPETATPLNELLDEYQQRSPARPILPAVEVALEQVVRELGTRSAYLNLERVRAMDRWETGADGAIGLLIRQMHHSYVINEVLVGSPAERSGLDRGDKLLAIDGESLDGLLLEEVIARLRGAAGSQVRLKVEFANGEQQLLNLRREKLTLTPVEGRWLTRGIAYIRIRSLSQNSVEDFNRVFLGLLRKVGAPRGLVLDLRDNPGGLLDAATGLADTFLARGPILQVQGRADDDVIRMVAQPGSEVFEHKLPLAVLISDYTASGAEAIAAALQDQRRAVIVGRSRSYADGLVHTIRPLPERRLLKLATGMLYRASGGRIEDRGVVPDICMHQGTTRVVLRAEVAASKDTACPYQEMSTPGEDESLLTVAVDLLADQDRYRQILQRGETGAASR